MSDSDRLRTQQKINIIQTERLTDALINGSQAGAIADAQIRKNKELAADIESYEFAVRKLRMERDFYKNLLTKPLNEIAAYDATFKETYEKKQEDFASWIVSQKAFKEVAMKYGKMAGKTAKEISEEGIATKTLVLKNQCIHHENNNIQAGTFVEDYVERLLARKD